MIRSVIRRSFSGCHVVAPGQALRAPLAAWCLSMLTVLVLRVRRRIT
jgi:hypothetical protein